MKSSTDSSDEEDVVAYYYFRRRKQEKRFWVYPYIEKKHLQQAIRSSNGAPTNRLVKHWMFLSFSHKFNV